MDARSRHHLVPGTDGWIVRFGKAKPCSRLRLFCFSFAGGGAIDFRDWPLDCPDDVEVFAVQLPGRGARIHEPPMTRMDAVAGTVAGMMAGLLDRPFVLFGHSLGGRVAFAVAQCLGALGLPSPRLLAVSASRAPGRAGIAVANLSDAAFLRHLAALGGTSPEVLGNDDLMDLMLPVLRADFLLHDDVAPPSRLLDCPVLACGGLGDREVSRADLEAWGDVTADACELCLFPGGHFYLRERRRALLATMLARAGAAAVA